MPDTSNPIEAGAGSRPLVPEGYHTVTPWIISRDTAGLIEFVEHLLLGQTPLVYRLHGRLSAGSENLPDIPAIHQHFVGIIYRSVHRVPRGPASCRSLVSSMVKMRADAPARIGSGITRS